MGRGRKTVRKRFIEQNNLLHLDNQKKVIKIDWKEIIERAMIIIGALALLALALRGLGVF